MVLLHELAHIRRWDWFTQLLAHFACAVYWFNPLVWLAARQLRIERERACDDVVLASGARASDYARELLALAARLSNSHTTALAAVPMARRRELEVRLRGILDGRRSRAGLTQRAVCLGTAFAAAAMVPLAMLRAAPPEPTEPETARPKPAPAVNLGSVERQVQERADDHQAPLALSNPEAREQWDLSLEEAVRAVLTNSKVVRNLGGVLFTAVTPQSEPNRVVSPLASGSAQDPKAIRGENVRFVLARTNDDVALGDFEASVRNLVCDVERAYWDLYYQYRNLAAVQAGRDSALQTWRTIYALYVAGSKGGEAEKEAQAREQYFLFRAQVENSRGLLYTAESRLRNLMGLAPTDGRLIRPADEPITAEVHFDLDDILPEALARSIDLRRQREAIEKNELKLKRARDYQSSACSDAQSLNRGGGLGDTSTDGRGQDLNAKEPGRQDNRGSGASENGRPREFQISGFTLAVPIGFRLAAAGVRNAELILAQSRALLQDQQLELVHVLTNSIHDLDRNYQVTVTTSNRRTAAAKQVEAVKKSYDAGTVTLDMLLDAQRRLVDAEIACSRALVDYNVAILQVHFRKGSLLERNGILLGEGASTGSAARKE
jgi:outer membrane protein TolC